MSETVRHVILDVPLRCFAQIMTAYRLAEQHGALVHITPGCSGEPTRKRPGMGSDCMPLDPARGSDRCRHDVAALRTDGAIDITVAAPCWTRDGGACPTCRGWTEPTMAVPNEFPAPRGATRPAQGALFG